MRNRLFRRMKMTSGHGGIVCLSLLCMALGLAGCAAHAPQAPETGGAAEGQEAEMPQAKSSTPETPPAPVQAEPVKTPYRPSVQWKPAFSLEDVSVKTGDAQTPRLTVGADIQTRQGKVTLRELLKNLAGLKDMDVSWTSDVNQESLVHVNIKAEDDFWTSLANILRQLDYFYEFKDNTIVIKYKETKRFFLPMPFIVSSYKTSVGGDLLGTKETTEGLLKGRMSIEHGDDDIDLWKTIQENLDKMLQLATTQVPVSEETVTPEEEARIRDLCLQQFPSRPAQQALCVQRALASAEIFSTEQGAEGAKSQAKPAPVREKRGDREGYFYTIDKPLGIITVTAPPSMLEQVTAYLDAVKEEMFRQVIIEAKIIEVELNRNSQKGIDWSELLKNSPFNFNVLFGDNGRVYPTDGVKFISQINIAAKGFDLFLSALNEYGNVRVLSNPKLSLLNGQPAMITVGTSNSYVDSVSSTIDSETGIVTFTVNTSSILSGLGFGVMANFSSDDEVLLHLTPVTSQLERIDYESFGTTGSESRVGLPTVFLRELTTMARVKNGQLLVIGGLIDERSSNDESKVPVLGDVPLVGTAFKNSKETASKRELIILLKPEVVNI